MPDRQSTERIVERREERRMQAAAERRGMGRKCLVFLILASLTCSLGDIGHMDSNNRSPPPNLLSLTRGMESCPISRSEASPGGGGHGADIAAAVGEALRLRGGGFVRQKRWYDDDIPEPKKLPGTSGITCLRYYLSPTGRRIYTLKKLDPTGLPTFPGHPPKFDPSEHHLTRPVDSLPFISHLSSLLEYPLLTLCRTHSLSGSGSFFPQYVDPHTLRQRPQWYGSVVRFSVL